MTTSSLSRLALCVLPVTLIGCPRDKNEEPITAAEALQAVEESTLESQAQGLTTDTIEIATHFTIGQAAEAAAQELSEFITTQLPCAALTLEHVTLTVDYGVAGDACLYHGKQITGTSQVSVSKNEQDEVLVEHTWTSLSNGILEVSGHATVTYDFADPSRNIMHEITVTRLRDGWQLTSEGDRTQRPLDQGILEGFQVDGTRAWSSPRGDSSLVIQGAEMRWVDPVPQAGSYVLTTPKNKELKLRFDRKDGDTITVTVTGPKRSFVFNVSKLGTATEVDH